ncbi:MAG: hypothetical protein WBU92_07310 [Candidatus Dormiibacterota bacterium]
MRNRRSGLGAEGGGPGDRGRQTPRREVEVVLRILPGEDLDSLSRE